MSHVARIQRRDFLRAIFLGGGAIATPAWLAACSGSDGGTNGGTPVAGNGGIAFTPGPMTRIGSIRPTGLDGISAPEGFSVRAVARHLSNPVNGLPDPLGLTGYNWHSAPDGGAVFAADDGGWVYVSNSEATPGGVGALRFSAAGDVIDAYRILDDTRRNCAGGSTPWQTWLSCEETGDGRTYECNPFGSVSDARVLPVLGRFNHEAAAVDLAAGVVYQTEDAGDGRFYRLVVDDADIVRGAGGTPQRLRLEQGRLQVMNVQGYEDGGYIENELAAREPRKTSWVDVVDPDQAQSGVRDTLAGSGVPVPGSEFRGGEGLWFYELPAEMRLVPEAGSVPTRALLFFASKGDNRVYAYDPDNELIQTVFDNRRIEPDFDDVDNVTVSPAGDVLVAEDGEAKRLIVLVPDGDARVLVKIDLPGSEITGPAFTADGSRLYFSSQRGPNFQGTRRGSGVTYELSIPEAFRRA